MSIQIPLRYSNQVFGHALVDDEHELLLQLGYFSVALPRSVRRTTSGRADVVLAFLREDNSIRQNCKPFISVLHTQVLLVHMVVRPEIARLLLEGCVREKINVIRGGIGRIVYVNGDKTDCRTENLREVQ